MCVYVYVYVAVYVYVSVCVPLQGEGLRCGPRCGRTSWNPLMAAVGSLSLRPLAL